MKRLSDDYTEYSGSAKKMSERIKEAGKDLKDDRPGNKDEAALGGSKDQSAVPGAGDPGVASGDGLSEGEDGVVEPPEPTRLTDAELAKHPDEYLQTISEEGEESETEDGVDAVDGKEGDKPGADGKTEDAPVASDAPDSLTKAQEELVREEMSAKDDPKKEEED